MSGNEPTNSGNAFGSGGQNDWHEQPTQGPHSPAQPENHEQPTQVSGGAQAQGGAQPAGASAAENGFGQQPQSTSYPSAPQQGQSYPSAPPQGQGYPSAPQQGYQAGAQQGGYGQPYQAGQNQYGTPGQGQNAAYGQPYQGGQQQYQSGAQYGQQQYGYDQSAGTQPAYGQQYAGAPYGAPANPNQYVHWGRRVLSYLVDALITLPIGIIALFFIPTYTLYQDTGETKQTGGSMTAVVLLALVAGLINLWNAGYRQGVTGQSIGKQVVGTKVIDERTGQPLGAGKGILRQFAHFLDSAICDIGFLWPLWDAKRQTFADKVMGSVVVDAPKK